MPDNLRHLSLPTETDTHRLAQRLARRAMAGDTFLLSGHVGVGKSSFARGFIRSLLGPQTDVPSPTFTLVQTYDGPDCEIWHCDLYRLSDAHEALELGLDDAFETAICLIEWPERLEDLTPSTAVALEFDSTASNRTVTIKNLGAHLKEAVTFDA